MKLSLEGLLSEKSDVNQQLAKIAQEERKANQDTQTTDELDQIVRDDAKQLRKEQRQNLVGRMSVLVAQIDE